MKTLNVVTITYEKAQQDGPPHHRHRAQNSVGKPFTGPIAGARENRAAHGSIQVHERCRCGAERLINANGIELERGPWFLVDLVEPLTDSTGIDV
jgi:hypothetical protein